MTAPTLTLETAEERELWRACVNDSGRRATTAGRPVSPVEWADAAVRAYRERCRPALPGHLAYPLADNAPAHGTIAEAIDMCDKLCELAEGLHSPRKLWRLERDVYMRADAARHIRAILRRCAVADDAPIQPGLEAELQELLEALEGNSREVEPAVYAKWLRRILSERCAPTDAVAEAAARHEGIPVGMYKRLAATTEANAPAHGTCLQGSAPAWPTADEVIAYDDERETPASAEARRVVRAIWDKPHLAPVTIQGCLQGSADAAKLVALTRAVERVAADMDGVLSASLGQLMCWHERLCAALDAAKGDA